MGLTRISRRLVATAIVSGVAVPAVVGFGAGGAVAATPPVKCASGQAGLAAELQRDITASLEHTTAVAAVSLRDRSTKTVCTLRSDQRFDSASTVKVTLLATLLWDVRKHDRHLTQREAGRATKMITASDNASTNALWKQIGVTKVQRFLAAAGMTSTVPGGKRAWGLTQITAADTQKLMNLIMERNTVLSDDARAYILKLMNKVIPSQRWGTPAGAPRAAVAHVKNGWLPRAAHGWRVHSMGAFTGGGRDYTLTVLTQDNSTMKAGVATVEAVARAVHEDLAVRR
ncbi:serine hydrolase [Streptomyces sp. NPDC086077]|uniref:serine hydrolase n=1 Tax=Streptomyces sp. NPDC086077 TaxID=3154862 RepID=UPI003429642F